MASSPPSGFVRLATPGATVVARANLADAIRVAVRDGPLFAYAAGHPNARALAGRGVAYAVPLPGAIEQVVVRHNRHGGAFAPFTRDFFIGPTRAPYELRMSEWLRHAGVPTPAFLAYAVYTAAGVFRRADVVTREIRNSVDLSHALTSTDGAYRQRALAATASLVRALGAAGARHHDLNVKNVLLARGSDGELAALVLDVDRVELVDAARAIEPNLQRLLRSARKWRERHGATVSEGELAALASLVRAPGDPREALASVR
jgi:tRNA A-37 threonylcarbamoyl transferase component Bud32